MDIPEANYMPAPSYCSIVKNCLLFQCSERKSKRKSL